MSKRSSADNLFARPTHSSGKRKIDELMALPMQAYNASKMWHQPPASLVKECAVAPEAVARLGAGAVSRLTMTETYRQRRDQLEAAGYCFVHQAPVKAEHIELLMRAWGFKSKAEAVRVAIGLLVRQTREGLSTIEMDDI